MTVVDAPGRVGDETAGSATGRPARSGLPWRRALLLCMAVAVLHGLAWSVVNPPAQGPDEYTHAQQTDAMAGLLFNDHFTPSPKPNEYALFLSGVPFSSEADPTWSPQQDRFVRKEIAGARWRGGAPTYGIANPPLYYALDALPTRIHPGWSLFDRLWVMRLGNLLMFAATVAFCFLFVRETIPSKPWAWVIGGLAVALQPLTGYMAGSVSVDSLLFAMAAALFWLVARAFRRGLTWQLGGGIGLAALAGSLTKSSMFGLLPGAAFGVVVLAVVAWRHRERRRALAIPVGAFAYFVPFAIWLRVSADVLHRPSSATTGGYSAPGDRIAYARTIGSYTWQVFFPRLPGMQDQYQDYFNSTPRFPAFPQYPLWQTWIEGFIGRFGWHQFSFPLYIEIFAAAVLAGLLALAARAVWRATGHLRRRRAELLTYFFMAACIFMLVTIAGYGWRASRGGLSFEQARYLLPLLPLYAVIVGAACVSLRRRWSLILTGVVGTLAAGHAVGALVLALGRYYT